MREKGGSALKLGACAAMAANCSSFPSPKALAAGPHVLPLPAMMPSAAAGLAAAGGGVKPGVGGR